MLLPDKMTDLTIHLAEGGKTQEALYLARKLLDRFTRQAERTDAYTTWRFERIVERLTPTLSAYGGLPALLLLCEELLGTLGEAAHTDDAAHDDSYSWRPAIEDHQQNAPQGFQAARNSLVSAIRDVAEQMIRDGTATLAQIVEVLEQFHAPIFARVVMHLLRLFPDQAREAVAKYLTTFEYFDRPTYRHEYALLSSVGFRLLTPEEQQIILGWIAATPDWASPAPRGDQAVAEGAERGAEGKLDVWRLQRLTPFAPALPPIWKARYDEFVQTYGVPEHPDFVMYFTSGRVDNTTGAVTAEQLGVMTMSQIIEYLETWAPSDAWLGPSREGMGQLLTEVIGTDPEPFTREAERFAELHPAYLAALFQGFERALTRQAAFPWAAILQLARLCLARSEPVQATGQNTSRNAESVRRKVDGTSAQGDPAEAVDANAVTGASERASDTDGSANGEIRSFAWVRNTIAHLLERALTVHPVPIAPELRDAVWEVLRPLTDDADPTLEDEGRRGDSLDPSSLAINSVRGVAMHAVILYAVWSSTLASATSAEAEDDKAEAEHTPLATLAPEVLEVLDEHLRAEKDASRAIRSIYGQRFPLLAALDLSWTAAHVAAIYPSSDEQRHLWEAAWDAYVLYNWPTQRTWTLLHDEYGRALEQLTLPAEGRKHAAEANARTVEHLIVLAWGGEIPIGEPGTLLDRAYSLAGDQLLGEVTSHVGLRVVNTKGSLLTSIRQRLQDLRQWRMSSVLEQNATEHQRELAAFGWWYGSGQFDTLWALTHLRTVLTLTGGRIQGAHLVLERLAETPSEALGEALGCLIQLVNSDQFGEYADVWDSQIGAVFTAVQARGNTETRAQAIQLINRLVSRGHVSFRAYLPAPTQSSDGGITE